MTLPNGPKTAIAGRLVAYDRVATDEQGKAPQRPTQTFAIVLVICVGKKGVLSPTWIWLGRWNRD